MAISSLENDKVKELVKLQMKKYRDLTGCFVVEGEHLVEEVIKAGLVLSIYTIEGYEYDGSIQVSCEVMKKISTMDSIPNIVALCKKKESNGIVGNKILILDDIQDPGNLGTIIRSSLAFNIDTIILSLKCVDLYNPKVLRATQGMFCHINIISMDTFSAIEYLKNNSYKVYGTSVVGGVDAASLVDSEKEKYALIMGNEGNGLSNDVLNLCDKKLYIRMNEKVESLNVGVACSILLYELMRK